MKYIICAFFFVALHAVSSDEIQKIAVRLQYDRKDGGTIVTGHGTAFGIDLSSRGFTKTRYLLTAAHNVVDVKKNNEYPNLKVELQGGWSKCHVVKFDFKLDVCLLEADDDVVLGSLNTEDGKANTEVKMIGSLKGDAISVFKGKLVDRFTDGSINSLVKVKFNHGVSGSPIFNTQEKIVGFAVAGIPRGSKGEMEDERGLFLPVCCIDSFLDTVKEKK